jgi:hypothetical protein
MIHFAAKQLLPFVRDIRFWIVLFFLIRMIGISNPPLDASHNWRQCTGIMAARNFLEVDPCILYPRVDDNAGNSGVVGMEFPVMNYGIFLLSKLFGFHDWFGRLINLIVSSFGVYFFFRLIEKYINKQTAFASAIILLSSIWFSFSRKTMPDTFCMSLTIIGIWYMLKYVDTGKIGTMLLAFLFITLGVLSKIPALYLFVIFALPFFSKNISFTRKLLICISLALTLVCTWWWYFYWNPALSVTFGLWYNLGEPFTQGMRDVLSHSELAFHRFYFDGLQSIVAIIALGIGLFYMVKKKNRLMLYIVGLLTVGFVLYAFKSGFYFYHHNYYIIPYAPVLALIAGYGVASVSNFRLRYILLIIIVIEGILNQQHDLFIKKSELYKLNLETIADRVSTRSSLWVVNGNSNPQQLYLAHRKGWTVENKLLTDTSFLNSIQKKGCQFILLNKKDYGSTLELQYPCVYEDDGFKVFSFGRKE